MVRTATHSVLPVKRAQAMEIVKQTDLASVTLALEERVAVYITGATRE